MAGWLSVPGVHVVEEAGHGFIEEAEARRRAALITALLDGASVQGFDRSRGTITRSSTAELSRLALMIASNPTG